jgi:hypothetical protein
MTNENSFLRKFFSYESNELNEMLRISIGNINTNIIQLRNGMNNLTEKKSNEIIENTSLNIVVYRSFLKSASVMPVDMATF